MSKILWRAPPPSAGVGGYIHTGQTKVAPLEAQTHVNPQPPRILHSGTWGRVGGHFSHRKAFY